MRPALILCFVLGLMAPSAMVAQEVVEEPPIVLQTLPEGYPWKIGDATISLDGVARSYTTFDFSVGALDSAVQFHKNYDCPGSGGCTDTGKVDLYMRAHPDGDSETENDVVVVIAVFSKLPDAAKKTRLVEVEIRNVGGQEGVYLRGNGRAKLAITELVRGIDGSDRNGHFKATVTGTICEATKEAMVKGGACHAFSAEYDTGVQYDLP